MPASTAAASSREMGRVTSMPETSPTNTGCSGRMDTLMSRSSCGRPGLALGAEPHHPLGRIGLEGGQVIAHALAQHLEVGELSRQVAVALLGVEVQIEQTRVRVALRDAREAAGPVDVGVVVARR